MLFRDRGQSPLHKKALGCTKIRHFSPLSVQAFRGTHRGGASSDAYQKTLRQCHSIMNETKPRLSALDWQEMKLKDLGTEDTVVFDPPYPSTNVRSNSEATVDYDQLVDTLLHAKFRWLLCGPALHRLGKPKRQEIGNCCWRNLAQVCVRNQGCQYPKRRWKLLLRWHGWCWKCGTVAGTQE
jgi:hypothetical protein